VNDDITAEEIALRDRVRAFAQRELRLRAAAFDESASFPSDNLPGLAALGLMGANLPVQWGGPGISAIGLMLAVEEIAAGCAATASMLTAHYLATDAILIGGDDAMRARYLPHAAEGSTLGAYALTEPEAGSNPADMRMRAMRDGAVYRLDGVKHFISNGGVADFIVVFAKSDPSAGHRGISAFVVDKGSGGLTSAAPEPTMGIRAGQIFELQFDGCRVPAENRIGDEGTGFKTAMRVLDGGRVEVAAMCLGIAQAAFDDAVTWVKTRQISGHALGEHQGIQWMLADMATDLAAARLLTRRAANLRERAERFSKEAAMAKLFASEMAHRVTDCALQMHGGYGYSRRLPLERYARDARIMRIYEGASEVQRNLIARDLLR
jgi:butyryl-CoA dehydrogenase